MLDDHDLDRVTVIFQHIRNNRHHPLWAKVSSGKEPATDMPGSVPRRVSETACSIGAAADRTDELRQGIGGRMSQSQNGGSEG